MPTPFDYTQYLESAESSLGGSDVIIKKPTLVSSDWSTAFISMYNPGFYGDLNLGDFALEVNFAYMYGKGGGWSNELPNSVSVDFTGSGLDDLNVSLQYKNDSGALTDFTVTMVTGEAGYVDVSKNAAAYLNSFPTNIDDRSEINAPIVIQGYASGGSSGLANLFEGVSYVSGSVGLFFEIDIGVAVVVDKYKIQCGATVDDAPYIWKLYGSDDGKSWSLLDEKTEGDGQQFTSNDEEIEYNFTNSTAYRYYRFWAPVAWDDGGVQVQQIKLMADLSASGIDAFKFTMSGTDYGPFLCYSNQRILQNPALNKGVAVSFSSISGHTEGDKWDVTQTIILPDIQYKWDIRPLNLGQDWETLLSGEVTASKYTSYGVEVKNTFKEFLSGENYAPCLLRLQVKSDTYSGELVFNQDRDKIIMRGVGEI